VANQRETTVVWDRVTGEPVGRAIGWQDRRTESICAEMEDDERAALTSQTGMTVVPNAAATKLHWLLMNDRRVQQGFATGQLICGTVDSWLVWNLSGGRAHVTDHSNASVTLLQDARTLTYADPVLARFGIPRETLPDIRSSSEVYAMTKPEHFLGAAVPIGSCVGDQQAAMLGQACTSAGMAKNTYGAGCFMVLNVGGTYLPPAHGTFSPVLWAIDGTVTYGVEAMRDDAGAVLTWMRDGLGIISDLREVEGLARQVPDSGGLHFVSTFGARTAARLGGGSGGILMGLGHRSTKHHIARAALESVAFQARDAFEDIRETASKVPKVLRVDGGGARDDLLMQFQADILGIVVERPRTLATTPVGAAYLAGLAVGFWESLDEVSSLWRCELRFDPHMAEDEREARYAGWLDALAYTAGLGSTGQEQ
jgi:glycerol kinase